EFTPTSQSDGSRPSLVRATVRNDVTPLDQNRGMSIVSVRLPSLDELAALDGREIDAAYWELEQARRRIEAAMADVMDRCEQTSHHLVDGHRSTKAWSMATTNCSPGEALQRHQTARVLRELPATRDEFRAGQVGVAQVHELARL